MYGNIENSYTLARFTILGLKYSNFVRHIHCSLLSFVFPYFRRFSHNISTCIFKIDEHSDRKNRAEMKYADQFAPTTVFKQFKLKSPPGTKIDGILGTKKSSDEALQKREKGSILSSIFVKLAFCLCDRSTAT